MYIVYVSRSLPVNNWYSYNCDAYTKYIAATEAADLATFGIYLKFVITCCIVSLDWRYSLNKWNDVYLQAHVYSNVHVKMNEKLPSNLSICSSFLANIDEHKSVAVKLFGKDYTLLPWSVIILPDCKTLAFNTAQVRFRPYFIIFKVKWDHMRWRVYFVVLFP